MVGGRCLRAGRPRAAQDTGCWHPALDSRLASQRTTGVYSVQASTPSLPSTPGYRTAALLLQPARHLGSPTAPPGRPAAGPCPGWQAL